MGSEEGNLTLQGWEAFFGEVNLFVMSIEREAGTANFAFSEYAVDRLEMITVSVDALEHHFNTSINQSIATKQ